MIALVLEIAAAAALANAVQLVWLRAATGPVAPELALAHGAWVVIVTALLALACGGRRRAWAAALFFVPALLGPAELVMATAGGGGVLALLATAALATLAVTRLPAPRAPGRAAAGRAPGRVAAVVAPGPPLVTAAAGALVGAELARFAADAYRGLATPPGAILRTGAIVLVAAGVALAWPGRRPARETAGARSAGRGPARGAAAAGLALGLVAAGATLGGARSAEPSPPPEAGGDGPPIVLIVLDTLRADHLELYGYARETMPALADFASRHAVVVERATATSPWSLPTHASLFTGLYPPEHGAHKPRLGGPPEQRAPYPLRPGVPTLAEHLVAAGYWTVGVAANFAYLGPDFGLDRGFHAMSARRAPRDAVRDRSAWLLGDAADSPAGPLLAALERLPSLAGPELLTGPPYRRAAEISDEAIARIEAAGDVPFFLFVNYLDVHWPYHPPAAWRDAFPGRRPGLGLRGLGPSMREGRPAEVLRGERDLTPEERAHLRALYDGEARALDVALGRLLARLERHPDFARMLVVITSDHGEALGEHRLLDHAVSLYDPELRVPLVIKPGGPGAPGAPAPGSRLAGPMQSVDVFATAMAHAGLPGRGAGRPWGRGRRESYAWLHLAGVPAQVAPERFRRELRSVERGRHKLVESSRGRLELYDLEADPGEHVDLAPSAAALRAELAARLAELPESTRGSEGEAEGPAVGDDTLDNLRALGYVE